jgi:hypothetical protein
MTQDSEPITQAYESIVKSLFSVFHTSRIAPGATDPAVAMREADQTFQRAMAAVKASRDRAIQLVTGPGA